MTHPTDDLAAQMVREMMPHTRIFAATTRYAALEAIARRYMEKLFTEDDIMNAYPVYGSEIIQEIELTRAERAGKDGR